MLIKDVRALGELVDGIRFSHFLDSNVGAPNKPLISGTVAYCTGAGGGGGAETTDDNGGGRGRLSCRSPPDWAVATDRGVNVRGVRNGWTPSTGVAVGCDDWTLDLSAGSGVVPKAVPSVLGAPAIHTGACEGKRIRLRRESIRGFGRFPKGFLGKRIICMQKPSM